MTGNDFREDDWQDTKMRKPGILGGVGGRPAPGGNSRRPRPGRMRDDWGWASLL